MESTKLVFSERLLFPKSLIILHNIFFVEQVDNHWDVLRAMGNNVQFKNLLKSQ